MFKAEIKERRHLSLEKGYIAYIMISPFIIAFCFFSLYTIIYTISMSFTNMDTRKPDAAEFIWFKQYIDFFKKIFERMWSDDKPFSFSLDSLKRLFDYKGYHPYLKALVNTWKIWLVNFIPQLSIAMLLSVWFNSSFLKIKVVGFWRSVLYLPNLLMPATVGVIFSKLFRDDLAPANQFLVGTLKVLDKPIMFLLNETFAQNLISFIQWWMWYGNTIIILVAGMSSISVSLYESAMIDGAGGMKMFRYITLPSLRPIMVFTLVTSLVGGMQMFDIPYLINAEGGPNGATKTMYMLMYGNYNDGKAGGFSAAVGVIILLMTTICSLIIFRVLRDKDASSERKAFRVAQKEKRMMMKSKGGSR